MCVSCTYMYMCVLCVCLCDLHVNMYVHVHVCTVSAVLMHYSCTCRRAQERIAKLQFELEVTKDKEVEAHSQLNKTIIQVRMCTYSTCDTDPCTCVH